MITADLTIADDWAGARDLVAWHRPDDWREVASLVRWDIAVVGASWVHLEAAAESAADQAQIRAEAASLAQVLSADLPFFLGVGPSMPDAGRQPQLPLFLADDPPVELLAERPVDLSWRMYFWMVLREQVDRVVDRARPALRLQALRSRGRDRYDVDVADLADDARYLRLLAATFPAGTHDDVVSGWAASRARRQVDLAERLCEQVAFQVEWILRSQSPPLVALVEEALAVRVEDAALGAALHIETDETGAPRALRLVSHDGRPRGAVRASGRPTDDLDALVRSVGR